MSLTALQVRQLNNMNAAAQRAGLGTLLSLGDPAGVVYYVDGNAGDDDNTGLSWGDAFLTLTYALAISNANIAASSSGWAARNRIYVKGDALDEDLVLLAQKTDVIGVGSYDQFAMAGLIGNHVPTGATCSYGTRFYNFRFKANSTGGDIFTLDSYNTSLAFYDCYFDSTSTTAATGGIVAVASPLLHVEGCKFSGAFSDSVIELGSGDARGTRIINNFIEGAEVGIELKSGCSDSSGATQSSILIKDNVIRSALEGIKDSVDIAMIVNNNVVTAAAKGTAGAGAIVGNELLSSGNKISCSDLANADWPALGSL